MLTLTQANATTSAPLKTAAAGGMPLQALNQCRIDGATAPIQIAFSYKVTNYTGRFHVVARVRWSVAGTAHEIDVDVTAWGTVFTVGYCDAVGAQVVAEGDSLDAVATVWTTAGPVCTGHPRPAHRTLHHEVADAGDVIAIPPFARRLRMASPDVAAAGTVELLRQPVAGAGDVVQAVAFDPQRPYQLAGGAVAFRLDSPTAPISTIWELSP